ncbi:hypothetical protein E2C01_089164 [Portunus trituberculatus]|uniref:Uncharacterized protein n=1 Tax=Portunus trituberculatus TaxID=210409 RepID=A0A5B7JNU4_PORTR|nr:hypothetical protein [Portunus trituberculatus]
MNIVFVTVKRRQLTLLVNTLTSPLPLSLFFHSSPVRRRCGGVCTDRGNLGVSVDGAGVGGSGCGADDAARSHLYPLHHHKFLHPPRTQTRLEGRLVQRLLVTRKAATEQSLANVSNILV